MTTAIKTKRATMKKNPTEGMPASGEGHGSDDLQVSHADSAFTNNNGGDQPSPASHTKCVAVNKRARKVRSAGTLPMPPQPSSPTKIPAHLDDDARQTCGGSVGQIVPENHSHVADTDRDAGAVHCVHESPLDHDRLRALDDLYRHKKHLRMARQAQLFPAYALARSLMRVGACENAKERFAKCKVAKDIVDSIIDGEPYPDEAAIREVIRDRIEPLGLVQSVVYIDKKTREIEGVMKSVVVTLPIWEWAKGVKGLGPVNVANVIANAGDIGGYKTVSALWKRFGLAPPDSYKMETKSGKTAIAKPRERRSVMFVVGDCLIKGNGEGEYRTLYLARKVFYREKWPDESDMHVHRAAQRVMEKELLKNLYLAWKRA